MRRACNHDKVNEPSGGIIDADDLAAETVPRTSQSLLIIAGVAVALPRPRVVASPES